MKIMKKIQKKVLAFAVLVMTGAVFAAENASVTTNGTEVTIDVSGGYSSVFTVTDVYGSDITKVIKTGKNIVEYAPAEAATFQALEVRCGQFRVRRADQLGVGTITLNDGATLMIPVADVKVGNKVVFGIGSYAAAYDGDDAKVALTSVGSSQAAPNRWVTLGRTGIGYCKVGLSLTGADSEAMDRIVVQGATDLTLDGGTVKVAAEALSPFFYDANGGSLTKNYTVTTNGVTVDVAAGADVALGISPVFPAVRTVTTNVVAAAEIENGGFSSNLAGWTIDTSKNAQGSGIKSNGQGFDTSKEAGWEAAWTTTNSPYLMIRVDQSFSRTITVPSDGLWRVVYDQGCRPGRNYYSMNMTTVVSVVENSDVIGLTSFLAPTDQAKRYGFKRFETVPVEMVAGRSYTLRVDLNQGVSTYDANKSMNFDSFFLEKVEVVESVVSGTLTKTGAGTLGISGIADATLAVAAGTVKVEKETLDGLSVTVGGGTFAAGSIQMSADSVVNVAADGILRLYSPDYVNELVNGDFEADGSYTDIVGKEQITGWTFVKIQNTHLNVNGSGLQGNGGNCSKEAPWTPESAGPVTVYLREDSKVSQTFTLDQGGTYTLSFLKACRGVLFSATMPVRVMLDDSTEIFSSTDNSKDGYERFEVELQLAAGPHTISFETGEPSTRDSVGAMVFIDDVRLLRTLPPEELTTGEVRLVSGSTLQLDNASKVTIRNLFVDGVRVNGGRKALEDAGVTVTGSGAIRVGEPLGLMMIFR